MNPPAHPIAPGITVVAASTTDLYAQALAVRRRVFVEEQAVPEGLEVDDAEAAAKHFLAWVDGHPAGAGRLRRIGGFAKLERIATLPAFRRQGVASAMTTHLLGVARATWPGCVPMLHAQDSSVTFYAARGWQSRGAPFSEAGIPHRTMLLIPSDPVEASEAIGRLSAEERRKVGCG